MKIGVEMHKIHVNK